MPDVRELKKIKKSYEVTFREALDKTATYRVTEDLVVEYRLVKGKSLTIETYQQFQRDQTIDPAFQKAKSALLRGPKSRQELKRMLERFSLEDSQKTDVERKLVRHGLFDEAKGCEQLVDELFRGKRYGPEKIKFTMHEKGYPQAMVSSYLGQLPEGEQDRHLEFWFSKKLSSIGNKSFQAARQALIQALLQKGYSQGLVLTFIERRIDRVKANIDEEKTIILDIQLLRKKLDRKAMDESEKKRRIIQALSRKGYHYSLINKML